MSNVSMHSVDAQEASNRHQPVRVCVAVVLVEVPSHLDQSFVDEQLHLIKWNLVLALAQFDVCKLIGHYLSLDLFLLELDFGCLLLNAILADIGLVVLLRAGFKYEVKVLALKNGRGRRFYTILQIFILIHLHRALLFVDRIQNLANGRLELEKFRLLVDVAIIALK